MSKRRKKKREVQTVGFGRLFLRECKRFAVTLPIFAVMCVAASAAVSATDHPALYALFYVFVMCLLSSIAVVSARGTMRDAGCIDDVCGGDKHTVVEAWKLTTAKMSALLAASVISSASIFAAASMLTTAKLASASAMASLSAVFYVSLVADVTSASHRAGSRRERRAFIFGFVGTYTIGLLVLIFVLACFSGLPLGDDFDGETIPEQTVLALSALYLLASAIRSVYLFFMLKKRLNTEIVLRKTRR